MAAGMKTSILLSGQVHDRRVEVKELTGHTDAYLYEHGLLRVEAEIVAARKRQSAGTACVHPDRYPSGRCRFCFDAPWECPSAAALAVAFRSAS